MKALEILGRLSLNMCTANPMERMAISGTDVYEAISELEALQQVKSCEGCKHYKFTYNSNDGAVRQLMTICSDCFRRLNRDRYEPKEQ